MLAVAVILVVVAVVWWSMDGRQRFGSQAGRPVRTEHALPAVASDSELGSDDAAAATDSVVTDAGEEPEAGGTTTGEIAVTTAAHQNPEGPGTTPENGGPGVPGGTVAAGGPGGPGEPLVISGPGGPYLVMVSSHHREASAEVEAAELNKKGVVTEIAAAEIEGRGTWFRIVVSGGYPTLARARAVLDTVKNLGYEGAWIERAPQGE